MRSKLAIAQERAALLCIDLQEEHRQDQRYLVEDFSAVLERVARLQEVARGQGVPVIHSAYVVDGETISRTRPLHPLDPDGRSAFSERGDPWTAICPEVAPRKGEALFFKSEASAFGDGRLAAHLKKANIEWLFVVGVWTEACVDASVRQAVDQGFRVILVKDACGSGTLTMHQIAILNLANRLYGGAVVESAGAAALLAGAEVVAWQTSRPVPLRYCRDSFPELYERI